jgi:hypothetical protein
VRLVFALLRALSHVLLHVTATVLKTHLQLGKGFVCKQAGPVRQAVQERTEFVLGPYFHGIHVLPDLYVERSSILRRIVAPFSPMDIVPPCLALLRVLGGINVPSNPSSIRLLVV